MDAVQNIVAKINKIIMLAKCTVLVIQHHCEQTFGTHLVGGRGEREPLSGDREFFRMAPRGRV